MKRNKESDVKGREKGQSQRVKRVVEGNNGHRLSGTRQSLT